MRRLLEAIEAAWGIEFEGRDVKDWEGAKKQLEEEERVRVRESDLKRTHVLEIRRRCR